MEANIVAEPVRNVVRDIRSNWQAGWASLSPWNRIALLLVLGAAAVGAVVTSLQLGGADVTLTVSESTYLIAPLGGGVVLVWSAVVQRGRDRLAWALIGLGVAGWGVGEIIWMYYSALLETEVPYPGWADVFYVGAYPIIFAGVLLLPHVRPTRWERARLSIDAAAGTIALSAVVWTFYLRDLVYIDPDVGLAENFINLAYPVGDLVLLVALLILSTRRSEMQFDGRLLLLGAGMAITTVADVIYVFQIEADTYYDGSRLDAVWLVAYGLFAAAAVLVASPPRLRELADRPGRLWPMIAPYTAIALLFALTFSELGGQATILQASTAVVGILIIARQAVAIRETRDIVEKQRNDLVASISHELRTPLTAMSGFTEILDDNPDIDRDERIEMISIVNEQTSHLSRIVGDLVEVARDNLAQASLNREGIQVQDLVRSAMEVLTSGAGELDITVDVQPGLVVTADIDRLRQVLVNYLTNASRYGDGEALIHACAEANSVIIEVHDNGPGIPKKYEVTVWDRFERGAHRYLSGVAGSGLGLAIARQLVLAHGGSTGHRPSELLGGTCFWLSIPQSSLSQPRRRKVGAVAG